MLQTRPLELNLDQTPTIRALRSVTGSQIETVASILGSCKQKWTIDQHADYEGYVSLMVNHEPTGLLFSLSGMRHRIEVAECRGESLHHLGHFSRIEDATNTLIRAITI